jgi:hypothetical protein
MKKSLLILLLSLPILLAGPMELVSDISPWNIDGGGAKNFSSLNSEDSSSNSCDLQIQENSKREEKREERTDGEQKENPAIIVTTSPEFLQAFQFDHREIPNTSTYAQFAIPFNKAPPVLI